MTFKEARAKFVAPVAVFGGRPEWPTGYRDSDGCKRFIGTVANVGIFELSDHEGLYVELWQQRDHGIQQRTRLTIGETRALGALMVGLTR